MLSAVLVAVAMPCLAMGNAELDGGSALVSVLVDGSMDSDGDGLLDVTETVIGTDPLWDDTDGDGLPDGYELWSALNPLDPADVEEDPDLDGVDNRLEYEGGTLPFDPDTDGDGYWDGIELDRGTDPRVNWSFPNSNSRSDVNCDGRVNAMDIQLVLNGALGLAVPVPVNTDYLSGINAADVQTVVNAACGR